MADEQTSSFQFTAPDFGKNPVNFFKEVRVELKKVTWPTRSDVVKYTIVVIAVSALVGLYLGALDLIFAKAIELVLARK